MIIIIDYHLYALLHHQKEPGAAPDFESRSYGEHVATTILTQAGYEGGCHDCNIQPIPHPILRAKEASSIEEESGDEFDEKP